MATVLDPGAVALADKLGLDLHYTKFIGESPHFAPCRCVGVPIRLDSERCFTCGRFLDHAVGDLYDEQAGGPSLLDAAIEVERIRCLREFEASGAANYEAWLLARLTATERSLERLCATR